MAWQNSRSEALFSRLSRSLRGPGLWFVPVFALTNACSNGVGADDKSGNGGSSSGGSSSGGANSGGSSAAGGKSGGSASVGGGNGSGGRASGGGSSGGASTSDGGRTTSGGTSSGGSGGDAAGGAPNGGECTRDVLGSALQNYYDALEAHDPSLVTVSASVKFTENAEVSEMGDGPLWATAGVVKYSQSALDVEACTVVAHAVVADGSTDVPMAIRLKLEAGEVTEIETIVARAGDYTAVQSNTGAIITMGATVGWETQLSQAEHNTHEELISWMDKYFRKFPQGVCDVTGDCKRLENGGGDFSCGAGASCSSDPGPNDANLPPRLLFGDPETGVGAGLTVYQGHVDMHMFKMKGGEVYAVQAILSHTDGQTGWD